MRAILAALINLAQRTGRFTVAEATVIYNGLWLLLGFILLACGAAFIANAGYGLKWPSLLFAIVFSIAAVYVWAKPLHILIVAGAGLANRIAGDPTLADEVENILKTYLEILKWVLLVGMTFLLITGTISFKENPGAFLSLLVALSVVGLLKWMWPKIFSGALGRRIIYGYAILVVVLSFGSLIPGPVWVKYMPYGWDPTNAKPTDTEDALYRLKRARRERDDANRAKELVSITERVKRGDPLTDVDLRIIAEAEQSQAKIDAASEKCPASHPCLGSTEKVTIPKGQRVCFDESFWDNLGRLGYTTSYQGGFEKKYGCTRDQVISGVCHERTGDSFRFIPEKGVRLPNHWFVDEDGTQC